jgi:hypothetical protein
VNRTRKHKDMLPNGRSAKALPNFENWHCRIFPKDFTYPAWRALSSPTAKDVGQICRAKSDHAAHCGKKGEDGRPVFEFPATEAEKTFFIPRPTFSKAIKILIEIGFIEVARYGGTLDGKGIPALYRLSDRWKEWTPPPRDNSNIMKARAARGKR